MVVDASSALYQLAADQAKLDNRVTQLCKDQKTSNEALLKAIKQNDTTGKTNERSKIKYHATRQAYEEFQKASAKNLTVNDVDDRRRKLQDTGSFMRMVRARFSASDLFANGDES
jgi:hypothetical protein